MAFEVSAVVGGGGEGVKADLWLALSQSVGQGRAGEDWLGKSRGHAED